MTGTFTLRRWAGCRLGRVVCYTFAIFESQVSGRERLSYASEEFEKWD